MDPIDTTATKEAKKKLAIETETKLAIETTESVEMVHLNNGQSGTPHTTRRKSMFYNTIRYFRKEDIARRFVELFPPFGFAEVFVVFFLVLMLSVSILSATGKLSPIWASYASWSPAFVVFFGAFGLRNNTVGMVLVFAGIAVGIWAIMDEEHSDVFFEHGTQAGVLIFVSIGAGWLMRIVLITSHHCGKRREGKHIQHVRYTLETCMTRRTTHTGRPYLDYTSGEHTKMSCITDIITSQTAKELMNLKDGNWCEELANAPTSPRRLKSSSSSSPRHTNGEYDNTFESKSEDDSVPPGLPPLLTKHFTELDRSGLIDTCRRVRRKSFSSSKSISPLLEVKIDDNGEEKKNQVLCPDNAVDTMMSSQSNNTGQHPALTDILNHEDGRLGIMNEDVGFINLPGRTVSCGSVRNGFFPPMRTLFATYCSQDSFFLCIRIEKLVLFSLQHTHTHTHFTKQVRGRFFRFFSSSDALL